MKKIVDGLKYDTETATCVAKSWNGYDNGNFNYLSETLFVTKSGRYFLHCIGGAKTKYADVHGNSRSIGEQITPMTPNEARCWLESNNQTEALEKHFADKITDA